MTLTTELLDAARVEENPPAGASALRRVAAAVSLLVAGTAVGCAIIGVRRGWNPLPLWDMWQGNLGFWYRLADGDSSVWWAQHAEHRILLARLVFWTDLRFFHGSGVLLVVANLVTAAALGATLALALRMRLRELGAMRGVGLAFMQLAAILVTLAFAWMQSSNFLWGFQVQFLLATVLPLLTYLSLGATVRRDGSWRGTRVALGLLLGTLSIATMASGLLTPAFAVAQLGLLRARRRVLVSAGVLALCCFALYLHGYVTPGDRPSPLHALLTRPVGVVTFLLTYLGGPVFYTTGVQILAPIAGVALILLLVRLGGSAVRHRDRTGTALTVFIVHIVGTGVLTAAGRIEIGDALTSRYTTPPLAAWACLLVLAAPRIVGRLRAGSRRTEVWLLAVPLLLLPQQLFALSRPAHFQDAQDLATLAVALGVPDRAGLAITSPTTDDVLALGRRAGDDGLTVLGRSPFRGLRHRIGTRVAPPTTSACRFGVLHVRAVGRSGYTRIAGELEAATGAADARLLTLVDPRGTVRGFAVPQRSAPGVSSPDVGFVGYVRAARLPDLTVREGSVDCRLITSRGLSRRTRTTERRQTF